MNLNYNAIFSWLCLFVLFSELFWLYAWFITSIIWKMNRLKALTASARSFPSSNGKLEMRPSKYTLLQLYSMRTKQLLVVNVQEVRLHPILRILGVGFTQPMASFTHLSIVHVQLIDELFEEIELGFAANGRLSFIGCPS